jgi:amicyanin
VSRGRTCRTATARLTACVLPLALASGCFSDRSILEVRGEFADCPVPLDAAARGDAFVIIRGLAFLPDTVRVRPGGGVTWINCEETGTEPHTSTAAEAGWNSPLLAAGQSFSRAFASPGRYDYHCAPHPFMRGVVIVE